MKEKSAQVPKTMSTPYLQMLRKAVNTGLTVSNTGRFM